MFTGIIETTGLINNITTEGSNVTFDVKCVFTSELVLGQSIAHDGVCLTVTGINGNNYTVTAIDETLQKTNLGEWKKGRRVNLERCMPATGRFDGHIVQGHVDTTATCTSVKEQNGSYVFEFEIKGKTFGHLMVPKGSVCVNGVSLTVVNCSETTFSVAIIPHTFTETGFGELQPGNAVNIEFDIVGKYIARMLKK